MPYISQRQIVLALSLALVASSAAPLHVEAAAKNKDKKEPAGTLLLPLTPRIDDGTSPGSLYTPSIRTVGPPRVPLGKSLPSALPLSPPIPQTTAAPATKPSNQQASKAKAPAKQIASKTPRTPIPAGVMHSPQAAPPSGTAQTGTPIEIPNEDGMFEEMSEAEEKQLLKGTVQIVADDTEYDQEKNTFLGTGNAVATIGGQDSKLEADTILYDQNSQTIDARGNVRIIRQGQLTTGSSFKFKLSSDEYMITDPDTELQGTTVVARFAKGTNSGMAFKNGTLKMPEPIHIVNNAGYGPLSASEEAMQRKQHPDAYVPLNPSYKFKARKMVYEQYKEAGNLTVFGGRAVFDHFTIPFPKFTATVGQENSRVTFPITPSIGNNLMVGGVNMGPSFNYAVGKTGQFSWAPLVQIGGRSLNGSAEKNNSGSVGAGFRISYSNARMQSHVAYGSVSNLLVGDIRYRLDRRGKLQFQAGINRFLPDGLFGPRRARLLAEVVHSKQIRNVPFLANLNFRTSAGWAQDLPSLVQLSGTSYSQLFQNSNSNKKVAAFRLQEQMMFATHPIFSIGDDKYGVQSNLIGGVAARLYSTGDSMLMGQFGPALNIRANRVRMQGSFMQSGVSGKSPFVFDQFIQGQQSVMFGGDVKLSRWLTLGGNIGYNLQDKMMYNRAITAAIGPEDFKVLISRDTIRGINRYGFDLLYGQPIPFNKLILKGVPDAGQLGGI